MLAHFKPFSLSNPLLRSEDDLETVFRDSSYTARNRQFTTNIDAIHECEDERDRQMQERRSRMETESMALTKVVDEAMQASADDGEIPLHIVEQEYTRAKDKRVQAVLAELGLSGTPLMHLRDPSL